MTIRWTEGGPAWAALLQTANFGITGRGCQGAAPTRWYRSLGPLHSGVRSLVQSHEYQKPAVQSTVFPVLQDVNYSSEEDELRSSREVEYCVMSPGSSFRFLDTQHQAMLRVLPYSLLVASCERRLQCCQSFCLLLAVSPSICGYAHSLFVVGRRP